MQCDGSLSSFIAVGLKIVLQKLLQHDMDTVVTMLMNMVGNCTNLVVFTICGTDIL